MKFIAICLLLLNLALASRHIDGAAKVLTNKKIQKKIEELEQFQFHSIETDQYVYELRVINTEEDDETKKFKCLYVIVTEHFLGLEAKKFLPLYFEDFESCL